MTSGWHALAVGVLSMRQAKARYLLLRGQESPEQGSSEIVPLGPARVEMHQAPDQLVSNLGALLSFEVVLERDGGERIAHGVMVAPAPGDRASLPRSCPTSSITRRVPGDLRSG